MNIDYDINEVADYAFGAVDWSSDNSEILWAWCSHADLNAQEVEEEGMDIESVEFQKFFIGWVGDQIDDAVFQIEKHFVGTEINLFRAISALRDWKPDPDRHPGIYWSWDYDAAEPHWGVFTKSYITWILETKVSYNAIDWVATLGQNALPEYKNEKEIRLKEGTPVKLIDYAPDWRRKKKR